jgi:MFS family permease
VTAPQARAPSAAGPELVRITVASFVCLLLISGLTNYCLPVYLQHLTADRGLPLDAISGGTSIVFVFGAVAGLAVARYVTTRDPRPAIVAAGLVGGLSVAGIGIARTVWQAYLAYAGMGVAFIACGVGPVMVAVLRHADQRKRASTLALATVGISMGGVVLSPAASYLIDRLGLPVATLALGALMAVVVTATVLLVMPASPAPPRDGGPAADIYPADLVPAPDPLDVIRDVPYARALRTPAMWLIIAATFFFFGAQIGSITHVVRLSTERGIPVAGVVVSVITASAVAARFLGGWALARVPLWRWLFLVFALQGTALVVLAVAHSTAAILAGALLLGVVVGNSPIITPLLVLETFGMLDYPRINAVQQIVVSVGQGAGPVLISFVHDRSSGYGPAYLTVAVVSATGLLLSGFAARAAGRVSRTQREVEAASAARGRR